MQTYTAAFHVDDSAHLFAAPTAEELAALEVFVDAPEAATPAPRPAPTADRDVAAALPRGPVMRTIGRPKPLVPNAAELARLAVADTRTAEDRVLDVIVGRLAEAIAEPRRPALRLVKDADHGETR